MAERGLGPTGSMTGKNSHLQMSQIRLDWIGGANAAQACQREVVVKHQSLLWVVETLDILEKSSASR